MGKVSAASRRMARREELGAIDMRPESSPYTSPIVTIRFADGQPLVIPNRFLDKYPKLSPPALFPVHGDKTLDLKHIPGSAGHVLVHYLFTGTYECLKPRESSHDERNAAEFATSVRVYAAAQTYELPALENLAKGEMEKLGNRLQVMQILDVLKDTLPSPSINDMWLQNYLKSLVRPFVDNPPASLDSLSGSSSQTLSIANALLKVVIELWREKLCSPSSSPNNPVASQDHYCGESVVACVETQQANDPEYDLATVEIQKASGNDYDLTTVVEPTL
ncbi:hypothetical protein NUW58_g1445 [Xylaria curta]|uniref:Uncharacterized protein n=1 Tax=Xylaria curta TaxID=42375 RepID=A0ACC1PNG8_9PEZI|nr:hypothetical protein NUW58_g1445 [Xylaria curta]